MIAHDLSQAYTPILGLIIVTIFIPLNIVMVLLVQSGAHGLAIALKTNTE